MIIENLIDECIFKAIRSSGSGGQHVNKVATKIELHFSIPQSQILSDKEKERLLNKLASKVTKQGELILQCSETRSQLKNKEIIILRLLDIITEALKKPKKRIPTKIPKAVIKKRIEDKKRTSEKKTKRKKPDLE